MLELGVDGSKVAKGACSNAAIAHHAAGGGAKGSCQGVKLAMARSETRSR